MVPPYFLSLNRNEHFLLIPLMTKDQLRTVYKEKRAAIPAAQKAKLEDLILIQFQKLDIEIPSLIMTYAVLEKMNEFDPLAYNRLLLF